MAPRVGCTTFGAAITNGWKQGRWQSYRTVARFMQLCCLAIPETQPLFLVIDDTLVLRFKKGGVKKGAESNGTNLKLLATAFYPGVPAQPSMPLVPTSADKAWTALNTPWFPAPWPGGYSCAGDCFVE